MDRETHCIEPVSYTHLDVYKRQLPHFALIQQLSMGQNAVNTVSINNSGEWLAFGSSKLGQLLVYEWQSESYILKQQGHFDSMNSLTYSPDGSRVVTSSDDGKIKIWDVVSGFCLATFDDHTSSVTAVQFAKKGQVLFSASLDGTVKAWDLIRYRNFRTFTAAERIQFNCLAVDPSGEVVCAGSVDSFEIHVWSVQTGNLLDTLAGHEGPVSCLSFSNENSVLASASWDKTIRIWSISVSYTHLDVYKRQVQRCPRVGCYQYFSALFLFSTLVFGLSSRLYRFQDRSFSGPCCKHLLLLTIFLT